MKKRSIYIGIIGLLLIAASLYKYWSFFATEDHLVLSRTSADIQNHLKVYAVTGHPKKVQFHDHSLFADSTSNVLLLFDGKKSFAFPKNNSHLEFFLLYDERYYCNFPLEKDSSRAVDFDFQVLPKDTTFEVSGKIKDGRRTFAQLHNYFYPFSGRFEIDFP